MDSGMKSLYSASEHLWGLGDGAHIPMKQLQSASRHGTFRTWSCILDGHASLANELRSATTGKEPDIVVEQSLGQVKETSLVVDGENSCKQAVSANPLNQLSPI